MVRARPSCQLPYGGNGPSQKEMDEARNAEAEHCLADLMPRDAPFEPSYAPCEGVVDVEQPVMLLMQPVEFGLAGKRRPPKSWLTDKVFKPGLVYVGGRRGLPEDQCVTCSRRQTPPSTATSGFRPKP